jgi:putative ABC transport system substrate-binding protein
MKAVLLLIGFVLATIHFAEAQQAKKVPRIGFVGAASASALASRLNAFRQGLRELDYIEGKNIAIEYRAVEGNPERLQEVAAELVSQKVDVIVTHGETAIRAFKQTTTSIPIVVGVTGDLVVSGHAASLARPGGNITGLVDTSPELSGKRLEILKDVLPQASRIAVLWNGANPVKILDFKETELAAHVYGLKLQSLQVRVREDFEKRLKAASTQRSGALVVLHDALTTVLGRAHYWWLGGAAKSDGRISSRSNRAIENVRDTIGIGDSKCPAIPRDRGQEPADRGRQSPQIGVSRQHVA